MTTDAASAETARRLAVVLFHAGGRRIALEARHVTAMQPDRNTEGENVPDVESLLGLPLDPTVLSRRLLIIRHPAGPRALRVPEPVEFTSIDGGAVRPLPPLIAARVTLPILRALHLDGDGVMLLIDPTRSG